MNVLKIVLISIAASLTSFCGKSQEPASRAKVVIPTIEQEASSIWRTINDIKFFEQQGYTINLPDDPLIATLVKKSKDGNFGNDDFSTIYGLLESNFFDKSDYEVAARKVEQQAELIDSMIATLYSIKNDWTWNFKMFDQYQVTFTLYGTGGSYDPDAGVITLLTNAEGGFKNYKNPGNTIIHEIIHMGIEYSIVQKQNLAHGDKERIVDTIAQILFKDKLPEYRIQNMGNEEISSLVRSIDDLGSLDQILQKIK